MRRLALVAVVGAATLLVAGCGSTDSTRLGVNVDASHGAFPAGWHVRVQESRAFGGHTTGGTRTVSAAHDSPVFDLRGKGRYDIGVTVEPADHSTGTGCAKEVVAHAALYVATIRLVGSTTCTIAVSRWAD